MLDYANKDSELVENKIIELDLAMERFVDSHEHYHGLLKEELDRDESEEYFRAEEQQVSDLKRRISNWIGTKEINQSLQEIRPVDSISNVYERSASRASSRSKGSSRSSSAASLRLQANVRKAILQAEAEKLEKYHALQREELRLNQIRRGLEIETQLAKAEEGVRRS